MIVIEMSRIEQALDIIDKLNATKQVYIIGHDIPVSISRYAYLLLERKRLQVAKEIGVPEDQYEFEDLVMILTGAMTIKQVKASVQSAGFNPDRPPKT